MKQGFRKDLGIEIANAIDDLVNWQLILRTKKTNEVHVVLNMKKVNIIHQIVIEWFPSNSFKINKNKLLECYLEVDID